MKTQFRVLVSLIIGIIGVSTVFFHFAEGWSWVDSYFFTVITISTVGYGNIVPVTVLGKLATTVLIFMGIGVVAVALNFFGAELVSVRTAQLERKKKKEQDEDKS
ncbi:MAG: voltage-gated potassium channel [Paracoccaceae bacterium]|jgi:voltage-gated potassium channel